MKSKKGRKTNEDKIRDIINQWRVGDESAAYAAGRIADLLNIPEHCHACGQVLPEDQRGDHKKKGREYDDSDDDDNDEDEDC